MKRLKARSLFAGVVAYSAILNGALRASDTSSILDVGPGYNVQDVLTSQPVSGGYTVANGTVHVWSNDMFMGATDGYQRGTIASGTYVTIGRPSGPLNSNGYGDPFGVYDAGTGNFYAGTYGNSSGSIYRRNDATGTWSTVGSMASMYGADIHDGQLYVSGLNAVFTGAPGQDNQIALFDLSGQNLHDVLIKATGNSANVAVDALGNVYYANYGAESLLYRWSAEQVAGVRADLGNGVAGGGINDSYLTYDDATVLTLLPDGANGIAVDDGGNVFLTVNGASSSLLMWNSGMGLWAEGNENHYEVIGELDANLPYGWLGSIDTEGDFLNGGSVYVSNYGSSGLAQVTAVPEPSTYMLAGLGIAALAYLRRSKFRSHS